jgi:thioester reductase-like protein
VGSNLILELLNDPGTEVYALTRAAGQSAEARLQSALRHAPRAAGQDDALDGAIAGRCHAVEGDVLNENCGVSADAFPKFDQFWHVAASLRYEDRYAAEIFRTKR